MEYRSVKEIAKRWQVSERRVLQFCNSGRIVGAKRFGRSWAIPFDAQKPSNPRRSKGEKKEISANRSRRGHSYVEPSLRVGAVIVAGGIYNETEGTSPFMNLGNISLIRRIVLNFQIAHVSPIVVVTGHESLELEHHLSDYGVIFVHNPDYKNTDKMASAKLGFDFIKDKCDKVFLASLTIPMFMAETLWHMVNVNNLLVIPRFEGYEGHPVLIDVSLIPGIMEYNGNGGIRQALRQMKCKSSYMDVADEGVLLSASHVERLNAILEAHNNQLLHPFLRISIEKDKLFFDGRAKLLLFLIKEVRSIATACQQMAMSRSKARDMLLRMEEALGFSLVQRRQGGQKEGRTDLTPEGELFLEFYINYERNIREYAYRQFNQDYKLLKTKINQLSKS